MACLLLSGRVHAKADGTPNMIDVNRVGKEANFNQYFTERVGTFLVAARVVGFDRQNRYEGGPHLAAFWNTDAGGLRAITRQAVLRLVGHETGHPFWLSKEPDDCCWIEFLTLFFRCFRGLALIPSEVDRILHDFSLLPEDDLVEAAGGLGIARNRVPVARWRQGLKPKLPKALVDALYMAEWAYVAEHESTRWFFASPTGRAMLNLGPPLPAPKLASDFHVQPDLSVFAGAGLAWEKLVPLFRYARIKRIGEVFEFRLDRKKLAGAPANRAPGEELRELFQELDPLPPAVAHLLGTKSKLGGKIGICYCSALVKPESPEALAAIRVHPQLKGYLEPGGPPGYLLVKSQSRPDNFVLRCEELGFEVSAM